MLVYEYDKHSGAYLGEMHLPEGVTLPNSLEVAPNTSDDFYSGGEWVTPTPVNISKKEIKAKAIRDAKKDAKDRVEQSYKVALSSGFSCSNGIVMDSGPSDITMLQIGYDDAITNGSTTMTIRDAHNVDHAGIVMADVLTMLVELRSNLLFLWKSKNASLAAIEKVVSVTAANALR